MYNSNKVEIDGISYFVIKASEVIEAEGVNGKTYWQGFVVMSPNGKYFTTTKSWQDTKNGLSKATFATPYYAEPKNIGKANETTNHTQALAEFDSMVKKEKRVRESERPLPMLAKKFTERKHKVKYPVAVQPKLDGMRMLTDGDDAWSRQTKPWDDPRIIEHIMADLRKAQHILAGAVLDGELILPWFPKVNETMSAAKKFGPNSPKLKYFVYDCFGVIKDHICDVPFEVRSATLQDMYEMIGSDKLVFVETHVCHSEDEVMERHEDFVKRGFEGTIIRDLKAPYYIKKRVDALLKYKDFIDEEFPIVDIIPAGGGSSANVGKFVCLAPNGKTFESTAMGSEEERRELLTNKHKYIGLFATVKYRELTEYGVPFHSNVREIRETKGKGY